MENMQNIDIGNLQNLTELLNLLQGTQTAQLPLLGLSPQQGVLWLWAWVPGVLLGLAVTVVLLSVRRYALNLHRWRRQKSGTATGTEDGKSPELNAAQLAAEPWYLWPFYIVRRLSAWYLVAVGLALALDAGPLGAEAKHAVAVAFRLAGIVQLGLLLSAFVRDGVAGYFRSHTGVDGGRKMIINALGTVATLLVWAVMAMMALNALGVNVTALVAGLGLGGVAIAFATKNILENVLASFTMVLNPPFVIGDFIKVGDMQGTVEEITLKNVKLRALGGEELVLPSNDLMNSRITNYSRLKERRVVLTFGMGYENATPQKLKDVPQLVRKAVEGQGKNVRFERAHLSTFTDDQILFEVVFLITGADYGLYMDTRQAVLLDIFQGVTDMGLGLGLSARVGALGEILARPAGLPTAPVAAPRRTPAARKR